jgi:serine/threonine protein kinase/tetratricopeptide (TPR) repeat protein
MNTNKSSLAAGHEHELALFVLATSKPAAERAAFLDRECGADAGLRARLDELLAAHEQPDGVLDAGPEKIKATMKLDLAIEPVDEIIGQKIGRYKILEKVGEGGCGVVYVAEQSEPVRRRVALKVIKLGMDTKAVVARFEAERQALAMMDHPNIAKVLDAGATDSGRPYFVMELVRGIKLTEYCDQNRLSTVQRLNLFIQICNAIQHAHQKGIIHRDIKPNNILVTLHDGVPVPKVIDFGIAKATEGRLTEATVYTKLHQFIGTPAYMSPEQAEMSGLDVDTRSDIYSLGVLLYELLTGRTPFDAQELVSLGIDAMRRRIRDQEPLRPSTRLATLQGEELTTTAQHRSVETTRLVKLLRGDLDWIVMKCLEKDRTRRYETASGLTLDLQRHLRMEPILARPPGKFYRLQKTIRRNKLAFAAAAAILAAVVAGGVLSSWQAVRASRARRQAEIINRFLTEDLLYQATPEANSRDKKVTMEEAVGRAAQLMEQDSEIAGQPEVEAALRLAIGTTYEKLGIYDIAERHLRRAVTLRQALFGRQHPQTLIAQKELVTILLNGQFRFDAETEQLSLDTWKALQRIAGKQSRDPAQLNLYRHTLDAAALYCWALGNRGQLEKAVALKRENSAAFERAFGPDARDSINELHNLAHLLSLNREDAEAEKYFREVVKRYERAHLAESSDALTAANNFSSFLFLRGKASEAESLLLQVRPGATKVFGPDNPLVLGVQSRLARAMAELGKAEQAETLAAETLEARKKVDPGHINTAYSKIILCRILLAKGSPDGARLEKVEALAQDARSVFLATFGETRPDVIVQADNVLGAVELARGNYAQAEKLLLPLADQLLAPTAQLSPQEKRVAVGYISDLYRALNKPDEAAKWDKKMKSLHRQIPV